MLDKLKEIDQRYKELSDLLADPRIVQDRSRYSDLAREHASLEELVGPYRELEKVISDLAENEAMLDDPDPEMKSMVRDELFRLKGVKEDLETKLKLLLIPKDPNDQKDVILEIRAGTGGDEAALFAADLFRMYTRYAEEKGWGIEVLSVNETGIGGFKEVIAGIKGRGAYSRLKFESGVHRVQRVPETEASGRIHTSAVTVAVLPEAEEVDVQIDPTDLRIDTYRSSGAGGQHVNKTESAVRITHIPTGIVVSCQDEKSQLKNREQAMRVLKSRLYEYYQSQQDAAQASKRKNQIGSGDRSERIRTYNFPQNRVSDHRINLTLYKLEQFIDGDMDEMIDALIVADRAASLAGENG